MGAFAEFLLSNAAWAGGLALLVLALTWVLRAPWLANRAWLLVLLKLITPPLVLVGAWQAAPPAEPQSPPPADCLRGLEALPELPDTFTEANSLNQPGSPVAAGAWGPERLWPLLGWLSLAGSLCWWGWVARRLWRFRRLLNRSAGVPDAETLAELREVAARMGVRRVPEVRFVGWNCSPMLFAPLGRGRILLPAGLWAGLTAEQRRSVLAHELAHYRRGDPWVRRLELLVLGLYWWFPPAWLAVRRLRRAEEACCDLAVTAAMPRHALHYAEALVETAAYVSSVRPLPLACGGASGVRELQRRLQMIVQPRFYSPWQRKAIALILLAGLFALPLGFGVSQEPSKEPAKGPDKAPEKMPERKTPARDPGVKLAAPPSFGGDATFDLLADQKQALTDEIELLQAEIRSRELQLVAAHRNLKLVEETHADIERVVRSGAASNAERLKSAKELAAAQAAVEQRQSELEVLSVKLKQAQRKLDRLGGNRPLMRPIERPAPPEPKKEEAPAPRDPQQMMKLMAERQKALEAQLQQSQAELDRLTQMTLQFTTAQRELQAQAEKLRAESERLKAQEKEFDARKAALQAQQEQLRQELRKLAEARERGQKEN